MGGVGGSGESDEKRHLVTNPLLALREREAKHGPAEPKLRVDCPETTAAFI